MKSKNRLLDSKPFKIYVTIVLLITLLFVAYTVITQLQRKKKLHEELSYHELYTNQRLNELLSLPGPGDYILPEDFQIHSEAYQLYLNYGDPWTAEQVKELWLNREEEVLHQLKLKNREVIEEILDAIP